MDYDGMAPVHQYFVEQPLFPDGDETSDMMYAAQLRGRGLLSVVSPQQQHPIKGAVVTLHNNGEIHKQASFDTIREWHHEHSIQAVKRAPSQVQTAHDWCQVAKAVR